MVTIARRRRRAAPNRPMRTAPPPSVEGSGAAFTVNASSEPVEAHNLVLSLNCCALLAEELEAVVSQNTSPLVELAWIASQ